MLPGKLEPQEEGGRAREMAPVLPRRAGDKVGEGGAETKGSPFICLHDSKPHPLCEIKEQVCAVLFGPQIKPSPFQACEVGQGGLVHNIKQLFPRGPHHSCLVALWVEHWRCPQVSRQELGEGAGEGGLGADLALWR